jgi:hypothetical protein
MTPLPAYLGSENHSARMATLLRKAGKEVRELCPRRNQAWRIVYIDGGAAYYTAGACPNAQCELAGLLQERLAEALGHAVELKRIPGEACELLITDELDRDFQTMLK